MQIKIKEIGYDSFTGHLGSVAFKEGVSEEITQREANQIAAVMRVEPVNPDDFVGDTYLNNKDVAAEVSSEKPYDPSAKDEVIADKETLETNDDADAKPEKSVKSTPAKDEAAEGINQFTPEKLQQVADSKGLAGLRAIGEPYGIKGKSIVEILAKFASKQKEQ